jgi:zinc protease
MDLQLATSVRFDYDPVAFDLATANLSIIPAPGQGVELTETALAAVVSDLLANGVSEAEVIRAKKRLLDSAVFARDSVQAPAHVFGMTLAAGGDISDIEKWPQRIAAVTREDASRAAKNLFDQKGIVTGILLPTEGLTSSVAPSTDMMPPAAGQGVH